MKIDTENNDLVGIKEFARLIGKDPSQVYRWIKRGEIRAACTIAGRPLFHRPDASFKPPADGRRA